MTFDKIQQLLKSHRTIMLISADNAPLIISFLYRAFKHNQQGLSPAVLSEKEVLELLSEYLYTLNQDTLQFPKQVKQHLTDWANAGFLRK